MWKIRIVSAAATKIIRVRTDRDPPRQDAKNFLRPRAATGRHLLFAAAILLGVFALLQTLARTLPQHFAPWQLSDAITLSLSVFIESLPFVILGTVLAAIVQVFVPQKLLLRFLPRNIHARRAILSCLGFFLPVCECGNVPLARTLLRRGFTPGEAITLVLAAPLLNPVTVITTYQAFGVESGIFWARLLGGFVIANFIGWIVSRTRFQPLTPEMLSAVNTEAAKNTEPKTKQFLTLSVQEMLVLLPVLAGGSLLAGVIQSGIATQSLSSIGSHPIFSILTLLALAAIVSICSTVDAFFMLGFTGSFLPGAIAAFLVFGAMIDIKMLLLLRTTFTRRALILITCFAFFSALVIGLVVNLIV